MVKYMRCRIILFVAGLGHLYSKESPATMFIGYMDISTLMVYFQQHEEDKLKDKK